MANEKNLKTIQKGELSNDELKKRQRNGGKKSAEVRRENKLIKDRILERMGETDWDEFIDGIIQRAKDSKADAEFLRDTIGQKPIDKVVQYVEDASLERLREDFGLSDSEINHPE